MKHDRKPAEQSPFVVILASRDGRRFRNVIMADNSDEARAKAGAMAAMLTGRFDVMHVRPAVGSAAIRKDATARPAAAMAEAEALARGSDRAE